MKTVYLDSVTRRKGPYSLGFVERHTGKVLGRRNTQQGKQKGSGQQQGFPGASPTQATPTSASLAPLALQGAPSGHGQLWRECPLSIH